MKFPSKLAVTLKSNTTGAPLPSRAIYLLIRARRKNDYGIGFELTDKLGQATFTEEEVKDEIEWTRNFFIMDYSSSYEECFPKFSVVLFSQEGIQKCKKALEIYKSYHPRYQRNFELIKNACNNNSAKQIWIFDSEKLTIREGVAHVECFVDSHETSHSN